MNTTAKSWGPVPLRLMLGFGFVYHGFPKFTTAGHQLLLGSLQHMGVPLAEPTSWLIGVLEVVGGLLLLLGYQVRLVAVPLIGEMLVAAVKVHGPNGFDAVHVTSVGPNGMTFGMAGFEFPLLYLVMLVSLFLSGAGRLSVGQRRPEPREIPREPGLAERARREREPVSVGR